MRLSKVAAAWALFWCAGWAWALGDKPYVSTAPVAGGFKLVQGGKAAPLVVSAGDWPGVVRAVGDLRDDVQRVTGVAPAVLQAAGVVDAVWIGTIGRSPLIDGLIARHKLDVSGIAGQWEAEVTTIVESPMPGVRRALVIAGSDKRGTIFGVYDLSEQMGVSPWYWWADVRVAQKDALYVQAGRHVLNPPAVKYRGIFLNDEAPALSGWTKEKFGGYNSKFYVHVFELLLRLKANYLWPAMWGSAFNEDDPLNPKLADEYGIVMGTSHHEPMLRAQQEWKRHGTGEWDYTTNAAVLDAFWQKGIERNKNYESTITLGMRGDGDKPMSEGANVALLEKIVADQRAILAENMTPQIASEPKVWALYKEVQDYYEKGMRVPDDVTLLWCDDNWGNIRRLPTPEERKRPGGAGIYYHFDYVGGPRSYKWLNTYSITKVWEQMNLALEYGADRIWVVNVGDLKPMEFPIEFFLSMAREPGRWGKDKLHEFTVDWAAREFGEEHAEEIATAVEEYTRYNARRKPEQLEPATFSLTNYDEAGRVDAAWKALAARVDKLAGELPEGERTSFFELVQYPVEASATVAEMYIAAGRNALYARQGRADANDFAAETRRLFAKDAELTDEYNHKLLDGRWDHMMDQTHIGYTFWNEPPLNAMPAVTEVQVPKVGTLGMAVQDAMPMRPAAVMDSAGRQVREVELFNRGLDSVGFRVLASAPWIVVSPASGVVAKDERVRLSVDWDKAPAGNGSGMVTVTPERGAAMQVAVTSVRVPAEARGFVEGDGVVSIEAAHTASRTADGAVHWEELPGFGETLSGMTVFPVTAASQESSSSGLAYEIYVTDSGSFSLEARLAPTLNFVPGRGLRFAVSVDDGPRMVVDALEHNTQKDWETAVSDGVKKVTVPLQIATAGEHTLHVWMVDPGVVLEKLELTHGVGKASYLGAPESYLVR